MNAAVLAPEAPTSSIGETITRGMVKVCLDSARVFQDWERANLIQREPTAAVLAEHRTASGRLMRLLAQLQAAATDPDWPLPDSEREVAAVLWQLRETYQALHHPMPEADAERILNEVFPAHGT